MPTAKKSVFERLAEPFADADIKLRPQTVIGPDGKKAEANFGKYPVGCKAKMLEYIDARNVMDRLDAVVGPENWTDSYRVRTESPWVIECTISLLVDGSWISRTDVGYSNNPSGDKPANEPAKAAYSDAFKRAAVKWGVGRFLYSRTDLGWVPVDQRGKPTKAWMDQYRTGTVDPESWDLPDDPAPEPTAATPAATSVKTVDSETLNLLRKAREELGVDDDAYGTTLAQNQFGAVAKDSDLTQDNACKLLAVMNGKLAAKKAKEEAA